MSERIDIQVLCPWCSEDMSNWYVNDPDNDYSCYDLPSIDEAVACTYCGNSVVVKSMTAPIITVDRGKSKEEHQLEKLSRKAKWKDQIVELKKRYPNRPNGSLKCKFFGHSWELLATSGHTSTSDVYKDKAFSLCKNCMSVLDTLHENPDDYGYWCK